ncbi:MAG: PAS domain S-box protein [Candidatus Krumholzibacteriota bacterium]|nr:PAS domain S-box protein [Candidatus Krumholzibacteriota bacterium]
MMLFLSNIIRHMRALTRLKHSEQKFRGIFHGYNDAVFIHDLSGQFLEVNQVACRRLGYSREELLRMTPMDLDVGEYAGSGPQRFQDVDQQGSLVFESVHRRKDGSTIAVEISSRKIDYEGKSCILSIARDITARKQSEEALRRSENYYRAIFETSGTAMFIIEVDTIISHANSYFEELSGYSKQEVEGKKSWTEFVHPDDMVWMKKNHYLRRQNPDAAVHQYEFCFITRYGETRNLLLAADIIPGTNRTIASCIDITKRKKSEEELRVSEQRFRSIFEEGPFGMGLLNPEGIIITANKMLCDLLGYTQQELAGKRIADITHEDDKEKSRELSRQLFAGHSPVVRFEKRYVRKDGGIVWVNTTSSAIRGKEGDILYAMMIIESLTEIRKATEKIHLMAYYDRLTELPNRTFLKELIKESIAHSRRHNKIFAIIYIGLDNFTRINDTLGHGAGDLLLKAVAGRLTSFLRKNAFVARAVEGETGNVISRAGGDEFIVLAHDLNQAQDAVRPVSQLLEEISKPYDLNGREVFITASMGIALYPDDGTDVDELLVNAEKAMRHTKAKGTNTFYFYSKSMHSAVQELLTLESDLHRALERNELVLYYQPKVDAATGKITGMEALIRWNHPGKGLIPPMEFIPVAETNGLILPIGEFVIRTVCAQIKAWQKAGYKQSKVALNVSSLQFEKQDLVGIIKAALQNMMISPKCLGLEITESTIMKDAERAIEILTELKALGIGVAIDDFGTGHSSLSYLKQLPLDFLKIDKSFIDGLASDSKDQAIVRTMIVMAHGLNMKAIAEGVETGDQLSFLQEQGCDEIQGYLFSRPLPADEIPGILAIGYL